jgi:hypothetical protein
LETYETWKGDTITAVEAKAAIAAALSQLSQSRAGDGSLNSLSDYIAGLPDGHERLRDLAHWCIAEGKFSLGLEASRYIDQFRTSSSHNSFDLLLSQVVSAQKRQNGRNAAELQHESA